MDETGWFTPTNFNEIRKNYFENLSLEFGLYPWNVNYPYVIHYGNEIQPMILRVIHFCLSLPEEQYVQNGYDRALIRRATKRYLPDKVRLNQQIRGVQGADWVHRMIPNWKSLLMS